ncbi:MAG: hypothetical protein K2H93_03275 [Oscillospiraceae bacterium]|nr:hypothetical protein [Oscillospiraceae bacterium]
MKKWIVVTTGIIAGVSCFSGLLVQAQKNYQGYALTDDSQAVAFYEEVMNQPVWYSGINRVERGELLQLPEDMIENMNTNALTDAVLDYPYFMDIYAFDNYQWGMDSMYESFNGIRALAEREDLAEVLLEKYQNEPILTENDLHDGSDMFRLEKLEMLISQDFVIEKMTEQEYISLNEIANQKYELEKDSDYNSWLERNLLFNKLGIISSDWYDAFGE